MGLSLHQSCLSVLTTWQLTSLRANYPREGQGRSYDVFYVLATEIKHYHIHSLLWLHRSALSERGDHTGYEYQEEAVIFGRNLRERLPQPWQLDHLVAGQYYFWNLLLISSVVAFCLLFLNH